MKLQYVHMLAIPAWLLVSSKPVDRDEVQRIGRSLEVWDRVGVPLTRALEARVPPPIGLNLFYVARRI